MLSPFFWKIWTGHSCSRGGCIPLRPQWRDPTGPQHHLQLTWKLGLWHETVQRGPEEVPQNGFCQSRVRQQRVQRVDEWVRSPPFRFEHWEHPADGNGENEGQPSSQRGILTRMPHHSHPLFPPARREVYFPNDLTGIFPFPLLNVVVV